jgi:peptide/nickel transport system substrate-binding protein
LAAVTPPTSFEPGAMAMDGPENHYYQAVYDTLLKLDRNGQPVADLVSHWTYDDAKTTLTLTLRSGVTFTDGTAFDAAAVKANLDHAKQGKGEAANALKFLRDVTAVDPTHATILLSAPDPSLVPALARSTGYMDSPKALTSKDVATKPVGTGPYTLDQTQSTAGSTYVYKRNPQYWNKGAYPYNQVDIKFLDNSSAILNGLRSGQIQGSQGGSKDIVQGAKQAGLSVTTYDTGSLEGVFLWDRAGSNTKALGDVRVRQAINYAFDRQTIVKTIKGGLGTPTVQFFAPSSTAYDASLEKAYPYDVAKAKQLMAQAGYPNGFSMTLPDFSPVFPDQQAAMTEALKAIGISITYQPITGDQVVGSVIGAKWPINYFTLTSTDAWGMAQTAVAAHAPFNPFHTNDPKVSQLLDTIQTSSGDAQTTAFHALDRYLVDQAWFAPWDYVKGSYITGKGVKATAVPGTSIPPLVDLAPAS